MGTFNFRDVDAMKTLTKAQEQHHEAAAEAAQPCNNPIGSADGNTTTDDELRHIERQCRARSFDFELHCADNYVDRGARPRLGSLA